MTAFIITAAIGALGEAVLAYTYFTSPFGRWTGKSR